MLDEKCNLKGNSSKHQLGLVKSNIYLAVRWSSLVSEKGPKLLEIRPTDNNSKNYQARFTGRNGANSKRHRVVL